MSENDQNQAAETGADAPPPTDNSGGRNNLPIILGIVALLAVVLIGVSAYMLFGRQPQAVADEVAEPAAVSDQGEEAVTSGDSGSSADDNAPVSVDLAALPSGISPIGDVMAVNGGQVQLASSLQPADDLYAWDGQTWSFVPGMLSADGQSLGVGNQYDGVNTVIGRRVLSDQTIVGAQIDGDEELAVEYLPILNEVTVGSVMLDAGGGLTGEVEPIPSGGYQQLLGITNVAAIVDQTTLTELLNDQNMQSVHIQSIANIVNAGNFSGVNLDYQGVFDAQEAAFTQFVTRLADELNGQGKTLFVTLATPKYDSGFAWDSAGQNWAAIGQIADGVYIRLPLDPSVYVNGGQADTLLAWATRQIDRDKITAVVSANAIDRLGGAFREMPLEDALANLGEFQLEGDSVEIAPGTPVDVTLAGDATPLAWEGESLTYKFTYNQNGEPRTVWINNNASLANRLLMIRQYGLRGASLVGLEDAGNVQGYVAAINSYITGSQIPEPAGAAITWTVLNSDGGVVASEAGDSLAYTWPGSEISGQFMLKSEFVQGDVQLGLDSVDLRIGDVAVEDPAAEGAEEVASAETSETEAAAEDSEDGSAEESAAESSEDDTAAGAEAPAEESADDGDAEESLEFTGDSNGRVNVLSNVRAGPGIIYAVSGSAEPGDQIQLIGRSGDGLWYEFVKLTDESTGWIYGQLVDVVPGFDTAGLPVSAVAASPIAVAASSGGDGDGGDSGGGGGGAVAPAPVAPANIGGGFELGGQTHTLASPQLMNASGMTWVKFQHKWGCGNNPADVQGRIDSARANGFKVLLSIPGSPYPSSIDFQCYVDFLGGVAALGPDAIEVWNEMNIDFEWPVGQISANQYVTQMLAPAYNAIKSANPNVLVISGAPAPTGFFGGGCGASGCDDNAYLAEMAAAGASQYMDCMGVHYNAGATSPNQSSGHPADGGDGHYSWYFQPMINVYYGALGKPLCFTELGYLSGQDYGGVPGRFSWAGNTTVAQHAQWLGEAVSIAANSGRVRMVIVFNVDFTLYADDPQAGFALKRKDGSCPGCGVLGQVMGQ